MMSQKGQTTTLEERIAIAERASAGQSSQEIAEALGRPLGMVRKWRQKYNLSLEFERTERLNLNKKRNCW